MRAIVTSDWHLDATTAGLARFSDVKAAVEEAIALAVDMKADLFVFVGDLTDPDTLRSHASVSVAVEAAARLWFEHGVANRWLVGNHDVIEDGLGASTLSAIRGLERGIGGGGIRVYDAPTCEELDGVSIVALPFTPRSHAYDPAVFVREVEVTSDRVVVFSHLNIEGIESGSETSDMPRGREVFLPLVPLRKRWPNAVVINGHYHKRQRFDGIEITGSLERLTFGEQENKPGFLVLEI